MYKYISYCVLLLLLITECKDNLVTNEQSYGLRYERTGLLDSIVGDCSTVITRVVPLDSIDFRGVSKIRMGYNAHTDADISFLKFFYISAADTAVNIVSLEGTEAISNMSSVEVDAPQTKQYFYLRMALRSSVCTGDIFHIKLRDLKIYTK
mgnify:FL=1